MPTCPLDPMLPQPYRLSRRRRETHDIFTIELEPTADDGGFCFAPGQFTMLYVFGVGEVPISISGDPTGHGSGMASPTLVHTIRAVGTVTKALRALRRGDCVGVVTGLIHGIEFEPLSTTVMMCGPEIMMRFTVHELLKRGVGQDHIWLSMERNMQCAVGFCAHCQFGPTFICKDGLVLRYDRIQSFLGRREV